MSEDHSYDLQDIRVSREPEQFRSLLAHGVADDDGDGPPAAHQVPSSSHLSLSRTASNGFPSALRTVNRVRFDDGEIDSVEHMLGDHARTPSQEDGIWLEAEDGFLGNPEITSSAGQRVPLLTNVEAPSVIVAENLHFDANRLLENARPKSGLM